jgi:hypothetical protein
VIEETVIPTAEMLPGFLGGYWLADRKTGDGLTITFFDTKENLDSSAQKAQEIRTGAVRQIGAQIASVEELEVVASTGDKVHRSAAAARVVELATDPSRVDEGIKNIQENVIPTVGQFPGFLGGFWLFDRSSGKGLGVTLFESAERRGASDDSARQLRERSAQVTGADISEPREFEVIARALTTAGRAG